MIRIKKKYSLLLLRKPIYVSCCLGILNIHDIFDFLLQLRDGIGRLFGINGNLCVNVADACLQLYDALQIVVDRVVDSGDGFLKSAQTLLHDQVFCE